MYHHQQPHHHHQHPQRYYHRQRPPSPPEEYENDEDDSVSLAMPTAMYGFKSHTPAPPANPNRVDVSQFDVKSSMQAAQMEDSKSVFTTTTNLDESEKLPWAPAPFRSSQNNQNQGSALDTIKNHSPKNDLPAPPVSRRNSLNASTNNNNNNNNNDDDSRNPAIVSIEQMMDSIGLEAPAPLPLARNTNTRRQTPAAAGAYRASVGQQAEQVTPLYKGGRNVLGRERQSDDEGEAEEQSPAPLPSPQFENEFDSSTKDKPKDMTRQPIFVMAGFALVVLIAVIIVVAVSVGSSSESNHDVGSSTGNDDQDDTTPLYAVPLEEIFPEFTLPYETRQAILSHNPQLPQVQAFEWLSHDENWFHYDMAQLQQRFALATFYYATGGPTWLDHIDTDAITNPWLDYSTHECSWYHIPNIHGRSVCYNYTATASSDLTHPWETHFGYQSILLGADPNNPHIIQQQQQHAKLRGSLVPELYILTNLQELDVQYQSLKGTIPNELTRSFGGVTSNNKKSLQYIYLTKCFFTGTVPARLFATSHTLFLSHNYRLTTRIPASASILQDSKLRHLMLAEVNLQGTIPTEIGLATGLQDLFLNGNDLTGTLPSEVGLLANLQTLDIAENELSGQVPSQIGRLHRLQAFRMGANFRMGGTLPATSLARLSNLRVLDMFKNSLEGTLSPDLFAVQTIDGNRTTTPSWPKLQTLIVTENGFTGTVPSEIGLIGGSLKGLFLARNKFQGPLPTELGLLSKLICLELAQNQFTGGLALDAAPQLMTDVHAEDLSSSNVMRVEFATQCGPN